MEDYKKKYDELLLKLQKAKVDDNVCDEMYYRVIDNIVPELKESEDERIMACIGMCLTDIDEQRFADFNTNLKECSDWLEKQGEHAKFRDSIQVGDKLTLNEDGVLVNLTKIAAKNFNSVQDAASGQKLAWSEEDEKMFLDIENLIHSYRTGNYEYELSSWFNSLKGRFQPQTKQEWSKDSKRKMYRIYSILGQAADTHAFSTTCRLIGDKECIELQDFLKSLTPQSTWKPSEEQIKALEHFVRSVSESGYASPYDNNTKLLYSLLQDLKKLKEK